MRFSWSSYATRLLVVALLLVFSGACGDDDTLSSDTGTEDTNNPDGDVDSGDANPEDAIRQCEDGCPEGEECVDDLLCAPICENQRCGENNLTCCGADEMCLGGVSCVAACPASQSLCGDSLELCCAAGDVCLGTSCVTPGDACGDDYDCLEADTYCEPTIGQCLPNPPPPLCEVRPNFEDVSLGIEWHWPGVTEGGVLYDNVVSTPAVGDVSGDGIPDVIAKAYRTSLGTGIVVAIDGATGNTLWVDSHRGVDVLASVAVANLDPTDDSLEVVYVAAGGWLVVLDGETTTVLDELDTGMPNRSTPSIHNIDGVGGPEIIASGDVFDFDVATTSLSARFTTSCEFAYGITVVANLDADPELEISCGGVSYDTDGTELWNVGGVGFSAVFDANLDGTPEVFYVRSGNLTLLDGATGDVLIGSGGSWVDQTFTIPGGGEGGPPTIADFDGDGLPEAAAAGRGQYAVYDFDCLPITIPGREGGRCDAEGDTAGFILWSAEVQDYSSSITGSSVFDFQGDGIAEVVYADECLLHVFDGRTGTELLTEPFANSSRTGSEYPLVVDVDRDGNSEIVIVSNRDQLARDDCRDLWVDTFGVASVSELDARFRDGTFGVHVLGDPADRWVPTRPIWNQHAYSVVNIEERGAVPVMQPINWTTPGLNNFRQNVQGEGVFNAPNLTIELTVVPVCGQREVRLSALVSNEGSRGVPAGVEVIFNELTPAPVEVARAVTAGTLLPGASEQVTAVVALGEENEFAFEASVDGESDSVVECIEDDNQSDDDGECGLLL